MESLIKYLTLTRIIFVIFSCSVAILIFPTSWQQKLMLIQFVSDWGKYIGITALVSGGILFTSLLTNSLGFTYGVTSKLWKRKEFKSKLKKYVSSLDALEQAVLREFYTQRQNSILVPYNDVKIQSLLAKGILKLVSPVGKISLAGLMVSVFISDAASDLIDNAALGLPEELVPSESTINFINRNRPSWLNEIRRMKEIFDWY